MLVGWVALVGWAAAAAPPGTVRSWTGVEARPDFDGNSLLRAEEQLAAQVELGRGWSLEGMGAVRDPAALGGTSQWDLLRLSGHYSRQELALGAGRVVRTGIQGMEPLDGLTVQAGDHWRQVSGWGGRLWHPERLQPRSLWVVGAEGRWRPEALPSLESGLGAEARMGRARFQTRGFASLSWRGPREGQVGATGELGTGGLDETGAQTELPARASLRASRGMGRRLRLGAALRWEELLPAGAAGPGPLQWLAPEGYGVAEGDVVVDLSAVRFSLTGGPTWRPEVATLGRWGRLGVDVPVGRHVLVGGTALGAAADASSVLGGLAHAQVHGGVGQLRAELGRYRFQAQTGPLARPHEARLLGELAPWSTAETWLGAAGLHALSLRTMLSVGADRTLERWVRGGLVVVGDFGGGGA